VEEITCSLDTCGKELVGVIVTLADDVIPDDTLFQEGFNVYTGQKQGGEQVQFVMLHPVCFVDMFHELIRQQRMTAITTFVGPIGVVREALAM
jgi:hypothetical protein